VLLHLDLSEMTVLPEDLIQSFTQIPLYPLSRKIRARACDVPSNYVCCSTPVRPQNELFRWWFGLYVAIRQQVAIPATGKWRFSPADDLSQFSRVSVRKRKDSAADYFNVSNIACASALPPNCGPDKFHTIVEPMISKQIATRLILGKYVSQILLKGHSLT